MQDLFTALHAQIRRIAASSGIVLPSPATDAELEATESALGFKLPEPLRRLLTLQNGWPAGVTGFEIWDTAQLASHGKKGRRLLFGAIDGGGAERLAFELHLGDDPTNPPVVIIDDWGVILEEFDSLDAWQLTHVESDSGASQIRATGSGS